MTDKHTNSKDSLFFFSYGATLNNNDKVDALCERFKNKIKEEKGL
jgi:hypothetical protein